MRRLTGGSLGLQDLSQLTLVLTIHKAPEAQHRDTLPEQDKPETCEHIHQQASSLLGPDTGSAGPAALARTSVGTWAGAHTPPPLGHCPSTRTAGKKEVDSGTGQRPALARQRVQEHAGLSPGQEVCVARHCTPGATRGWGHTDGARLPLPHPQSGRSEDRGQTRKQLLRDAVEPKRTETAARPTPPR